MPATIENEPNVVKNDMNIAPAASACLRASCFVLSASSPRRAASGWSTRIAWSVAETPPEFETKSALTSPGLPRNCCAGASGINTAAPSVPAPS